MSKTLIRAALSAASLALLPATALAQVHEQPPIGEPVAFERGQTGARGVQR